MKALLLILLALLLLQFNCATINNPGVGNNKPGIQITIVRKDEHSFKGELIKVNETSLLLKELNSGNDVDINIQDINAVVIPKKKGSAGPTLGFLIGGAFGWGMVSSSSGIHTTGEAVLGALLLGGLGALVGGAGQKNDKNESTETFHFAGSSAPQIEFILEKLRKGARIQEYY